MPSQLPSSFLRKRPVLFCSSKPLAQVRTRAVKSGTGPAYDKMLWFVYVFWPLYPILWLIGPQVRNQGVSSTA